LKLSKMKPTPLEKLEKLEQLRALENGFRIKVIPVDYQPIGVDTPEDLQRVVTFLSHPNSGYF
jgi:3-deoxy-manno-octulosonate cytidylyltransferase (CMP-KDO synthetase)